jgi:hypothetical protein
MLKGLLGRCLPALLLLGGSMLASCEAHHATAIRGAPEYLHQALSGDISAQALLADCYGKSACVGFPSDPAMACAWRGVRLASQSDQLTLADAAAFAEACASSDPTFQQRASIALADFAQRIYGRGLPELRQLEADAVRPRLYPSIDQVRLGVNAGLAGAGRPERLPVFGKPTPSQDGKTLQWSSCAEKICLTGVTPGFGGGIALYRVTVTAGAGGETLRLAASLAGAGLQSPSVADSLSLASPADHQQGAVCWRASQDARGATSVQASLAPCAPET